MSTDPRFWSAFWNFPGCLPEGDSPPPVFGSYGEAAECLAEVLSEAADGYEEGDEEGDAFEEAARECRESDAASGFGFNGPDGLNYYTEEVDPLGYWIASDRDGSDGMPDVLVYYGLRDSLGGSPTHEEAAEAVSSLCGSSVEFAPDVGAYVLVDSTRLREAAGELRESGFQLLDEDGDAIDPAGPEDLGPDEEAEGDRCDGCGEVLSA